jgi:hypothetical protein
VVLTKLDGDSRGGAALSVRHVTGKPIKFVGVGEKLDGLEAFHPDRMASRDPRHGRHPVRWSKRRTKDVDVEAAAQELADKLKTGKGFDLNDFKPQISQMKKMGGAAVADGQAARADRRRPRRGRHWARPNARCARMRGHHQLDDAAGARASPN